MSGRLSRIGLLVGLLSLGAGLPHGPAPAPAAPSDCGDPTAEIPDFALLDMNPNSPTYGQEYTQDGFLGRVLVVYWATAT
ncbi:MAG: hypothetical protein H6739_08280 [Alphaproteobacteria bacterium]|nr:hypothetical protein [Alphaproteobacteria bacterium]